MKLRFLLIFATLAGCSQRVAPIEITASHPAHPGAAEAPVSVFTIHDDFEAAAPESDTPQAKHVHGQQKQMEHDMPDSKTMGGHER